MAVDTELLITLVQARPVLWDKTLPIYKDKIATKNAWQEVCRLLEPGFTEMSDVEKNLFGKELLKRWSNVRDAYTRPRKKIQDATKSGAGASHLKKYVFNDQLQFLHKVSDERQTEDSLTENTSDEETEQSTITFKKPDKSAQSSRKRKMDPVEEKILTALEEPDNRHISFFKGVLPSLENFDEDDILQLQMGILQLITDIKRKKEKTRVQASNEAQHQTREAYLSPVQPTHQPPTQASYTSLTPVHVGTTKEYYSSYGQFFSSTPSPLPSPALSLSSNYTEESTDSVDFVF